MPPRDKVVSIVKKYLQEIVMFDKNIWNCRIKDDTVPYIAIGFYSF
jgi:hypothetical protein